METPEVSLNELEKIRREKLENLRENGRDPFNVTKYEVTANSKDIINNFEEYEGKEVSIAGRIMTKRDMGKASFIHVQDTSGQIQSYVRKDELTEEAFVEFKKYDIGDIIGIKGIVFKTQKGEVSIRAKEVLLLSKSLKILPEKYHGLKDTEVRYRQRYLDELGFIEVETPILHSIAGGAAARPFKTHHNTLDMDMYLRIAPELKLKRLIVGGFEKVYEIGRVFRNEGMSIRHNPEFTMIELYQAYADYEDMMNITEGIIKHVTNKVLDKGIVEYNDVEINIEKPFERISMIDLVKKYAEVDFKQIKTLEEAIKLAKEHHLEVEKHHKKGDILNLFFEKYAEDKLIQPTFVIDYPVEISPLSKRKKDDLDYTERFELFIGGREYANAFSELNDPIDQRERFKRQEELRKAGDDEACEIDEDFLTALEY
ncbi:lysine--tRNA ligase, partial [Candidatus Epulonipiscium fishelsonii]